MRGLQVSPLLRILLLAVLLAPSATDAGSVAPGVVDSTRDSITLTVSTPAYQLDATGVRVPGYAFETRPGQPRLPVYGTLIPLPSSGAWQVTFEPQGSQVLPDRIAVTAVPAPQLDFNGPRSWTELSPEELPSTVPVVDRPDPTTYGVDAFYPAEPVVADEPVWQGDQRLLPVRVYPFQYNPVTQELRYHPEFRIEVRLSGETVRAVSPVVASAPHAAAQVTGHALRIRTSAAGLYRLTYADLVAAGVPGGIETASFAMAYLGQPIHIRVQDADGILNEGDLVIFYAEAYRGRYMKENVYFFTYGGAASGDRMAQRTIMPTGSEPVRTTITRTLHIEYDESYYSTYPLGPADDHFFDNSTLYPRSGTPVSSVGYNLALTDPVTTGNVAFRGQFYGGLDQSADPDQSVTVRLNSHTLTTFQWDGRTRATVATQGPASWLDAAPNVVTMEAALAQLPSLPEYYVYVDWVELDYPALAKASQDRLDIRGLELPFGATAVRVETRGFSTDQVAVYDVRDPRQPVILNETQTLAMDGAYDVSFADAWPSDAPAPGYYLTTEAALAAPVAIEAADAPAWNTPDNAYDYIAVVHPSLSEAIQPLLAHRAAQGLRVAEVNVQHIYDLYSSGRVDPEAIRAFLTYAYWSWNVGGPRPRYVLLVGDGHYDFKNATNTPLLNLIPPYLLPVDPWIGETAADNRYVSVNGADDYMPDMALGRISAQSPAEATAAVNKILAYEDPARAPVGDWQNRVTFVADAYDPAAGDFQLISEDVRLNWLPASYDSRHLYWLTDYTLAYPDVNQPGVPDMNTAIKAAFTDSVMVQWFGHASKFRWGSTRLFNTSSIPTMAVSAQWPLSVDYSCWTGYFINLAVFEGERRSLSEALLTTAGKGAVAVIGPSGQHVGGALEVLNQGLVKAIFQDNIQPVGDAINAAKQYFRANSGGWYDVVDTTVFFGDPAMRLRLAGLPEPPAVDIAHSLTPAAVDLDWAHLAPDATYQIWRGETPYFEVADGALISTVDAGSYTGGQPVTFTDAGLTPPPPVTIVGDATRNYFWFVRGANAKGVSVNSNRVGEFDYTLWPGGQ